ncbi:MAG: sel1 repeat family protein, partial [Asticcacaulis sp.]|nr:sel1 repeat family protein [Asticcacaulis sp.]
MLGLSMGANLPAGLSAAAQTPPADAPRSRGRLPPPAPAPAERKWDVLNLAWRAQMGDVRSQTLLGDRYHGGRGIARDDKLAVAWLEKAANQGDGLAQMLLGEMYRSGDGIPQDYAAAMGWFQKAADQDYEMAQYRLGDMYAQGQGAPRDDVQAYKWITLSLTASRTQTYGDGFTKQRDELAGRMTPAQILEAEALVKAWRPAPATETQRIIDMGNGFGSEALGELTILADSGN